MKIEEMTFNVTKTETYEIIINKDSGYDMPETAKELVDMVNGIHNEPVRNLDMFAAKAIDSEIVINSYEVKEVK